MHYPVSSLYSTRIKGLHHLLSQALEKGLSRSSMSTVQIFFRADDIGVPSKSFFQMTDLFKKYDTPLCLALVPAWLSRARWQVLAKKSCGASLFCYHQHGWRHANHELEGKKQEFGQSRQEKEIFDDVKHGRDRLATILGDHFFPVFTPPWNRCGRTTINTLIQLDFKGISRSLNASPPSPSALPDFQVNVDLHTRKEDDQNSALQYMLSELENASASGRIGIMLHHQRMNSNAFQMLDKLLKVTDSMQNLEKVSFKELAR